MNTNVENGIPASNAMTPSQCQNACQRNSSCMGVDWLSVQPSGSRCWMSGPWSGRRNDGTAAGVVHYDITRNCPCKTYLLFVFDIDLILSCTGTYLSCRNWHIVCLSTLCLKKTRDHIFDDKLT